MVLNDGINVAKAASSSEPAPEPEPEPTKSYPDDYTVQEVQDYVTANPSEATAIRDAEVAGQNRITLVDWLNSFITAQGG